MDSREILQAVEVVSAEKAIDREVIFEALEAALAAAIRKRSQAGIEVRVEIDRASGEFQNFRRWLVVAEEELGPELADSQIGLAAATERQAGIELGEYIEEPTEGVAFGRIAAQIAKQVIVQKVREAERQKVAEEYEPRVGEMLSATVKRMDRGNAVLDLGGNAEALLRRDEMLPNEHIRVGDRVRVLLGAINPEPRGPQLLVNRTSPQLVIELFKREVPEVADGLVEVVAAARDPGSRAKIGVRGHDKRIDPIGACVGMHGTRVQSVSNELGGERIDITLWDETPAQFVINALSPAAIASIYVDEENNSMDVAVEEEQLSLAIGRGGQNVRLASQLTNWVLNIMSEQEAEEKAEREVLELIETLMEELAVNGDVATALIEGGFSSVDEIAYVPKSELLEVTDVDPEELLELRSRAQDLCVTREISREELLDKAKPEADLLAIDGVDDRLGLLLAEHQICTKENLADQSVDELMEVEGMTEELAGRLIMAARADWFTEEEG